MAQLEGYPLDWLQELKDKNNIVEVISRYVPLKAAGGGYTGCCPFHHDKTPSFSVNESGQYYHCFGCQESGDVIKFIQKIEGLTFPEAVEFLAERAGMVVPQTTAIEKRTADDKKKRDRLYEILTITAKFYHESLMSDKGEAARQYLEKRGIGKNLIVRFGLGFSPDYNSSINNLKKKGYTDEEIVESGVGWVSARSENKRPFDGLQQRLIIPVFDLQGRVIAYTGRVITKEYSGGKYVNSHNSSVYVKGKNVFAANFVKLEKQKVAVDRVILVEGNMDVISLAKYGYNNVVAGMGTAFTPMMARIIARLADNVYVCYDGDAAGQKAAMDNLKVLNDECKNLRIVTIDKAGMDPDDYVKKFGREGFNKLLDKALPYVEYVLSRTAMKYDLATVTGRGDYVKEALVFLKTVPNDAQREVYLEIVHNKSRVALNILRESFASGSVAEINFETAKPVAQREGASVSTEAARFVLNCMLSGGEYAKPTDIISEEVFDNEVHRLVFNYIKAKVDGGEKPAAHMLYSLSQDEEVASILNAGKEFSDETKLVKFYSDSVRQLNVAFVKYKIKELSQQYDNAPAENKRAIWAELLDYQNRLKELK